MRAARGWEKVWQVYCLKSVRAAGGWEKVWEVYNLKRVRAVGGWEKGMASYFFMQCHLMLIDCKTR